MEVLRRRQNTYGKATKKILVHDLFGVNSKDDNLYESLSAPTIDHFLQTRTGTPLSELSEDPETSRQLNHELQATFQKSRSSSAVPSARSHSIISASDQSPPVFEIHSSEDEIMVTKPVKTYKRRKIATQPSAITKDESRTPASPSPNRSEHRHSPEPMRASILERNKASENKSTKASNDLSVPKPTVNSRQEPGPMPRSKPSPKSCRRPPKSPASMGSPASERSTESMRSTRSTPKRKRASDKDALSDFSSPSQLELSSLRLTPTSRTHNKAQLLDLEHSDSSMGTPSRSRRRMVDKLDSPRAMSRTKEIEMKDTSPRPAKARKLESESKPSLGAPQGSSSAQGLPQLQLPRENSSQISTVAPKARTYGKQRSHLQGMVSSLSSQSQHSSQNALHQLVSQVDSISQPKEAFEIGSEDDEPATKLKSIHELRQAGLVNRFDRALETILEDVESGKKALRIQGLMQLVRKLQEQAYKRMLLESGKLHRLTSIAQPDLDLTTTSIILLALWALAVSEVATAQALSLIYAGILRLPIQIIHETRSISRIARDRKENLSKALIRDIGDLESHVVDQSLSAGRQASKNIIISRIALRSLEYILKRLIELAELVPEPPVNLVDAILESTSIHTRAIGGGDGHLEHVESIRLLVLWLEMTAATSKNIVLSMSVNQLMISAETIAQVLGWAKVEQPLIQQSCIRSAVELSNGNGIVCDQFAQTDLLVELFKVIETHFARLRDGSDEDGNATKLDSVILALGCMLNLMDHSKIGRTRMMTVFSGEINQVDVLVKFFKQYVEETEEAISEAQIQLLIPFGYVMLLLCTLCLDESIKDHVKRSLGDVGMKNLVNKAEVFLSRMQAVDSDSFVDRFSTTISTVKGGLVCA